MFHSSKNKQAMVIDRFLTTSEELRDSELSSIPKLAAARNESNSRLRGESIVYACKIKEAANGSRRRACGEAREAFQVVA